MSEVLAGAIRTATIKGINFALLREPGTYAQCVFPLAGFSCSPKDHADLAAYTAETACQICQYALYNERSGLTKVKTRADVDRLLAELEKTLKQELSAEHRSNLLSTKSAYVGAIGLGPEMLLAAQESHDLFKSPDSAKALANALFVNGRVEEMAPLLEEVFRSPGCAWMDRLHYATSLRYQGRVHEAAVIERENHCAPARYLPYWQGQPCETLHIFGDDGFGDIIFSMRHLEKIKSRGVKEIIICLPQQYGEDLAALLRAQPWMPKVVMVPEKFSKLRGQITCAISSGDIDHTLDLPLAEIPRQPLWTVNKESKKKYQHLRTNKLLIGICWSAQQLSQPWMPGGVLRSLSHSQVERIVREVDSVQFVSLQYKQSPPIPEILSPKLETWRDTAGLIANLDAVVCVDTAVMHLAEGMRKPTFVLSSGAIDCRLKYGNIFYPSARIFRNDGFGFETAIDALISELKEYAKVQMLRD
jgi:Glycosyltransferase family 9 (heptosyltransferase)